MTGKRPLKEWDELSDIEQTVFRAGYYISQQNGGKPVTMVEIFDLLRGEGPYAQASEWAEEILRDH